MLCPKPGESSCSSSSQKPTPLLGICSSLGENPLVALKISLEAGRAPASTLIFTLLFPVPQCSTGATQHILKFALPSCLSARQKLHQPDTECNSPKSHEFPVLRNQQGLWTFLIREAAALS